VTHRSSDRHNRPLIPVVCRSFLRGLSGDDVLARLAELLTSAKGSTLYLDEITDIPPPIQEAFLRLLDESNPPIESEEGAAEQTIRVIAATAKDLRDAIEADLVSKDFLNRVNAVSINIPPLRERKEDICLLVNHFLFKYNAESARKVYAVDPEALSYLLRYHWPGNVIQLENVIERAFALGVDTVISVSDLPAEIKTFGDISKLG
jgi:DNA-binding NtrC family response regulator